MTGSAQKSCQFPAFLAIWAYVTPPGFRATGKVAGPFRLPLLPGCRNERRWPCLDRSPNELSSHGALWRG